MTFRLLAFLTLALAPAAAMADDPRDPAMRNAEARARDSEATRRLNLAALANVRERDAREAQQWRATGFRGNAAARADYAAQTQDYRRAMDDYARDRARYERDMAAWRRSVDACRSGDYSACDN